MAEQRFTNTSVNLKAKRRSQSEVKRMEDYMYEEMDMKNKGTKQTSDTNDKRCACVKSCTSVIACWAVLLLIMALRIYCTTWLIHKNEDLMRSQLKNEQLEAQNKKLETEKKNLTDMMTSGNELNVSRAQWSIDAYCPKDNSNNRRCKTCQKGWDYVESSCYATVDAKSGQWKTWEEAREDCRGKISDLIVVINEEENKTVIKQSWKYDENKGYWIGLRVEDGRWKWLDGRNLTNSSWLDQTSDGHCAISVHNQGFKSVSCNEKNRWICKKKALSV